MGVDEPDTIMLYRPVGPKELALIRDSGFRAFPPRLPEQPIFYPVLTEEYATKIARDWNVKTSGSGCVTRFSVRRSFLNNTKCRTLVAHGTRNTGYRRKSCRASTKTSWGRSR
jgi:hypothetical protein